MKKHKHLLARKPLRANSMGLLQQSRSRLDCTERAAGTLIFTGLCRVIFSSEENVEKVIIYILVSFKKFYLSCSPG